jgi:hypothetical protein
MLTDPHHMALEQVLARHLRPLLDELRLTDLATFADHVINGREANMAEIVAAAAELHFAPGFIHYDRDSGLSLDWGERPSVSLGVSIAAARFEARVRLIIRDDHAAIELQHLSKNAPNAGGRAANRAIMERELRHNSFAPRQESERPAPL